MDLYAVTQLLIDNGAAVPADKVCVTNEAGFVLHYFFNDVITGETTPEYGGYAADHTQCTNISDAVYQASEGDALILEVRATAGETLPASTAMVYKPGASTINFICKGSTLIFSCNLVGDEEVQAEEDLAQESTITDEEILAYIELANALE